MHHPIVALSALLCVVVMAAPATAQLDVSPKFSITQNIDSVDITITGSRPSMRGRTIFGDVRPWGLSWTPGANYSTAIKVDRDFEINGKEVPAGRYSIWMVPRQHQPWLMMLDPRDSLFHGAHPDSTADQYHFHVNVEDVDPVETLTWSLNDIRGYRTTVRMEWANKRVEFGLRIKSNLVLAVEPEVAQLYMGSYQIKPQPGDTTRTGEQRIFATSVSLQPKDSLIEVKFHGGQSEEAFGDDTYILIPAAEDLFTMAEIYEGELISHLNYMFWEFTRQNGIITSFEVRFSPEDQLWLSGERTP